jgi:hypothetical protein
VPAQDVPGNPLLDRLDPADGPRLLALGCRLVWATTCTFVWLDDEIAEADRRWVRAHHPGRALLHRVDPLAGLTEADLALVRRWLPARQRFQPGPGMS